MKLKHALTILFLMLSISIMQAQKIKIKKGIISVDGTACLSTDGDPINISFYDTNGEEIIFMKYLDTKRGENYMKITFLDQKLSLTSKSIIFTRKMLVRRLLSNKVIENCKLNPDKVERFILKFDENIEKEDININVSIDRN
ncbi:hypothetical protein Q4512_12940 [Oceanihabitans sp. 2_MG-2023]|uniref:hypothetical protein n=1 Tax=Oceanihabitans sp. 2_MG-2023 TaxID=3062661 RepID=UPI0026E3D751|nr:hypothetical protein [Oceanihabitans sp. 2_MG-2023]MDO6597824.1 hypothetical protein [Oceanihabitans sp. 2_MG-2023]